VTVTQSCLLIFLLLRSCPAWLALSRPERRTITADILGRCHAFAAGTRFRFFGTEGFSAACTDMLLLKAPNRRRYSFVIELLRSSRLFSKPYFDLVDILPALEDGHLDHENQLETVA